MTGRFPSFRPVGGWRLVAALAAALVAAPSCDGEATDPGLVSDSTYVDLMARLWLVQERHGREEDEAADSARRAVLAERGVSEADLRRYAERHGDDPFRMAELWRAVEAKAEELRPPEPNELDEESP